MPAPVLILACGNPSRGDDALGPMLLERLAPWLEPRRDAVEALTDFQLQVEHVLDLQGRRAVLFVDAAASGPAPWALHRVVATEDASVSSHALSPGALLATCARVVGAPPPAFALAVRGYDFDLGRPLSPPAQENLEAALTVARALCADPSPAAWDARCATPP